MEAGLGRLQLGRGSMLQLTPTTTYRNLQSRWFHMAPPMPCLQEMPCHLHGLLMQNEREFGLGSEKCKSKVGVKLTKLIQSVVRY
jgi:hypothetical protein